MYYCYILRNTNEKYKNLTYNGFTVNLKRRLRQHNGEIVGGAKYTKNKGNWEIYAVITGFLTKNNALSFEWQLKHVFKKRRESKYCGPSGRILSLNVILPMQKWTNKCIINNNECKYSVYILQDMIQYINMKDIPDNITIYGVEMDKKIENVESLNIPL